MPRISIVLFSALVSALIFGLTTPAQAAQLTPTKAYAKAVKISKSSSACSYNKKSMIFLYKSYGHVGKPTYKTPDAWLKYLEAQGRIYYKGKPPKGAPVFYAASGGGLVGISDGAGKVLVPSTRGCITRYSQNKVPGTWYHAWGKAKF